MLCHCSRIVSLYFAGSKRGGCSDIACSSKRQSRQAAFVLITLWRLPAQDALSRLHQRSDVGGDRIRQALEVVAAFEHGDDAASGACVRNLHELARRPIEIRFEQIEVGEGVAHMRVEACRDHDQVGPYMTVRSDQKMSCEPLPWCTSKSTTAARSIPCCFWA